MSVDFIRQLQAYGFIAFVILACLGVYGYWFHLKHSEKTGRRNYEKYANLALDDELGSEIIESRTPTKEEKGK
ncbi:cytochrome c oxidase, cbb3-type, CcoQ subunit [Campylobacter sp. JMF_06 NA1]|uniref:cytochrome c oxidase, cbb3-type, CcoQ subunit n=1 Tax=Campylobacter sp. JMF_06 NA1 TaxID=2983823 RepID=UPI0022E9E8E9|nr:cytochrome c oxidase, cbb3-type, CcoQ subunit [Campylobacter sp. JMF_06 NA1]MDA3077867.1 cytochrome c oxidase, cbb3-type, CcoQ subunit [Campylobacter sp. JMF_06 NA1]